MRRDLLHDGDLVAFLIYIVWVKHKAHVGGGFRPLALVAQFFQPILPCHTNEDAGLDRCMALNERLVLFRQTLKLVFIILPSVPRSITRPFPAFTNSASMLFPAVDVQVRISAAQGNVVTTHIAKMISALIMLSFLFKPTIRLYGPPLGGYGAASC